MQIDLEPKDYRVKGRPPKVRLTISEAMSFAIGSTLATRKRSPPSPDKSASLLRATALGLVWYFTHNLG